MLAEKEENNRANEQNIGPNNPIYASGSNTDNNSIEEWWSIFNLMLMQANVACCIFWNNYLWKLDILYNNVLDILSELKNNRLPRSVTITCMLTSWLLLSLCCVILNDKGCVIDV